jgi:hypothetical protein
MKNELKQQIKALEKIDPTKTKWKVINGEIYVDKELSIAYAKWVSPEFGRKVEDAFNANEGSLLA